MPDQASHITYVVVVRVNTQCTLACRYCAYSRELERQPRVISDDTLRALGTALATAQQLGGQTTLVSWLGGEPFQWEALERWTREFVKTFGLRVSLTTNGLALANYSVRKFCLEYLHEITVSIDGDKSFHEFSRKAPGLYERLEKSVMLLLQERNSCTPRLRVNCVLMRENVRQFDRFCETMKAWGIDELTFNALGGNDRPEFYQEHRLQPEDVRWLSEALPSIRTINSPLQIRGSIDYLRRIEFTARNEPIPIRDCEAGKRFLFVDEYGNIGPCSFTASKLGLSVKHFSGDMQQLETLLTSRVRDMALECCDDCHATHVFAKFAT